MDLNQLASQLQKIASLYSEILVCIAAAGILGWLVGMMMRRSLYKRKLAIFEDEWKDRYNSLELSARTDAENLEEQLQALADQTKSLQTNNRELYDSLRTNEVNAKRGQNEAIELNRQHAETHDRLQRIIERKDHEILELSNKLTGKTSVQKGATTPASVTPIAPDIAEREPDNTDTIPITSHPKSSKGLSEDAIASLKKPVSKTAMFSSATSAANVNEFDDTLDDTSNLSEYGLEESTLVMDDDALALAQQSCKGQRHD